MKPYVFFCIFLAAIPSVSAASSMNPGMVRSLRLLDPQTRLEQRCDIEAMERLAKDFRWASDKVLAYAFSEPKITQHHIIAKGAAFRSKGRWYRLSFDCRTDDTNMIIKTFSLNVGDLVPLKEWDKHYLVP